MLLSNPCRLHSPVGKSAAIWIFFFGLWMKLRKVEEEMINPDFTFTHGFADGTKGKNSTAACFVRLVCALSKKWLYYCVYFFTDVSENNDPVSVEFSHAQ